MGVTFARKHEGDAVTSETLRRVGRRANRWDWLLAALVLGAFAASPVAAMQAPARIDIYGKMVFPENITALRDGTIVIGGSGTGAIYRVTPGGSVAEPWIAKGAGGMMDVLGVLADEPAGVLWVCSNDRTTPERLATSLIALDLATGSMKARHQLPGGGACNDMTVSRSGDVYLSDTMKGRIFRLAKGAADLTLLIADERLAGVDGIVFAADGQLYCNTYGTGRLFRVGLSADGAKTKLSEITPSRKLIQPDGMRLGPKGEIFMTEGSGALVRVRIKGSSATIETLRDGFLSPASIAFVGDTAWVIEAKFNYRKDPKLAGFEPGVYHAYAVPLRR